MRIFIIFAIMLLFGSANAASRAGIVVDKCNIDVSIMRTDAEHAQGMLGYTDRTFPYGGMLFEMKSPMRKVFHTEGMQMSIMIMGVKELSNGAYVTVGGIYKAPPGLPAIVINAPHVLEIPEKLYNFKYRECLNAFEEDVISR